jgi:hypothetical protein
MDAYYLCNIFSLFFDHYNVGLAKYLNALFFELRLHNAFLKNGAKRTSVDVVMDTCFLIKRAY